MPGNKPLMRNLFGARECASPKANHRKVAATFFNMSKSSKLSEHYTFALKDGKLTIHSVVVEMKTVPVPADAEIRHQLDKRMRWRPADNFGHVIQQLKKGRVYLARNGTDKSCLFVD